MHVTRVDLLFWIAGLLGHAILLIVLFVRLRATRFPLFTALIANNLARSVVLYITLRHGTRHTYFDAYWSFAILDTGLQLAVVYEIASLVFRPLGRWAADIRRGARLLVLLSLLLALALTWLAAPVAHSWKEVLVIKGSFFSSALMSELFVGMVALSTSAGLPWKTHIARIAQGLGTYSVLDILIEAGHTLYGASYTSQVDRMLSHGRMCVYLCCVVYWIVALWADAPAPRELPVGLRRQLSSLQERAGLDVHLVRSWRR